jgi:WD40 repeat protein
LGNIPSDVGYIDTVDDQPVALPSKRILFFPENRMVSWGHWDMNLRICSIDTGKVISVIECPIRDETLCAAATKNGRVLVTGGTSSLVRMWARVSLDKRKSLPQMRLSAVLQGHHNAVTCMAICENFGIIVTGSRDGTGIIWDLSRQCYVRSLQGHDGPVCAVAISGPRVWSASGTIYHCATSNHCHKRLAIDATCLCMLQGDIVTADQTKQGSTIRLWSINGELLSSIQCYDVYVEQDDDDDDGGGHALTVGGCAIQESTAWPSQVAWKESAAM